MGGKDHLGEPVTIAPVRAEDEQDWLDMRCALWPESPSDEHAGEIAAILGAPGRTLTLMARAGNGEALGFAEASVRHDYVNGCLTSPVAFLEGIYVKDEARRHGVARRLVSAVEAWALERGYSELASDALLDNAGSHAMHDALGFEETGRVVYFRKGLG